MKRPNCNTLVRFECKHCKSTITMALDELDWLKLVSPIRVDISNCKDFQYPITCWNCKKKDTYGPLTKDSFWFERDEEISPDEYYSLDRSCITTTLGSVVFDYARDTFYTHQDSEGNYYLRTEKLKIVEGAGNLHSPIQYLLKKGMLVFAICYDGKEYLSDRVWHCWV